MEKPWQMPFEGNPALVAHFDDVVCAKTRLLCPRGDLDENVGWMRAFFAARMAAKYDGAHTVCVLHLAGLSFHRLAYPHFIWCRATA